MNSGNEGYIYRWNAQNELESIFIVMKNNMIYIYKDEVSSTPL